MQRSNRNGTTRTIRLMPSLPIKFIVSTENARICPLFSIVENQKNGDLIIPIAGGDISHNDIDRGANILENRYSIHRSPRSPAYTTIKLTSTSDKESTTLVALTDAVKAKNGFSPVFIRRCQDPTIQVTTTSNPKTGDQIVTLPSFDPKKFTLFHGLFVGHPDTDFSASDPDVQIAIYKFTHFQLVFMASLEILPSYGTTEIFSPVTTRPENDNPTIEQMLRVFMMGRPPSVSLRQYKAAVNSLKKSFLKDMSEIVVNPALKERLNAQIAALSPPDLGSIKLGTTSVPIHMLTDVAPPDPTPPEWQSLLQLLKEAWAVKS